MIAKPIEALCIGGPCAGKIIHSIGDLYRVHIQNPLQLPEDTPDEIPRERSTSNIFTYRRVTGLRGSTEIDFWVPEYVRSGAQRYAFEKLITTYQKAHL